MGNEKGEVRVVRLRSPNYPSLPLQKALELAEVLLKNHSRYPVSAKVAAETWEVSPESSYMAQHIAALSYYGLIETEGEKDSKTIKISELAYKILMDKRPDSQERRDLIKEAALKPGMMKKIFDTFPSGLPADHALEYELTTKHKFNPSSVNDFIMLLKKNVEFAQIYKSDIIGEEKPPTKEPDMDAITEKNTITTVPTQKVLPSSIPVAKERQIADYPAGPGVRIRIVATGEGNITQKSIEKLIKHLELDKEDFPEDEKKEN
jgi:predicted transcriptional regulator